MNSDSSSGYGSIFPIKPLFFNPEIFSPTERFMRIEFFYDSLRQEKFDHGGTAIYRFYQDALKNGPVQATEEWLRKHLFLLSDTPSFYLHEQEFVFRRKKYVRKSLVVAIDVLENTKIFNHEQTFLRGIKFHYNLLKNTHKNFEPIFLMYKGMSIDGHVTEVEHIQFLDYKDEYGNFHRFYRVSIGKDFLESFTEKQLVVANGHHRIEASKLWGKEKKYGFRLAELVNIEDPGLKILPTHRVVLFASKPHIDEVLTGYEVKEIELNSPLEDMIFTLPQSHAILYDGGTFFMVSRNSALNPGGGLATEKFYSLSVFWLHEEILKRVLPEKIEYFRSPDEAVNYARDKGGWAILLPPPNPKLVFEVASSGRLMPQKSTDFYPKLLAGTIILDLNRI